MVNFLSYLTSSNKPVIVFDGATGTSLQDKNLCYSDFGGKELEGCNEHLVISSPNYVEEVHNSFLKVGCDVIETNTFGANSIVLDEYGIKHKSYEINLKAANIARKAANIYSNKIKPRFVAGSIGPTTKLPTLGHISFDKLRESYAEQAQGLIDGGIDLFLVETCQDVLQIKAALLGIKEAIGSSKVPIMVSVTMETTGCMLVGTDITTVVTILEPFEIDILGLNCATGPVQMKEHIKYLSENSPFHISCIPNAGLPENVGGIAHYKLSPIELKLQLMHFVEDLGVQVIGGCCGTTPTHIEELTKLADEFNNNPTVKIRKREPVKIAAASSLYESTPYKQDNSFLIVGERLNASGSKKVRELLNNDDWDGLISIAKTQVKENAHILDVNVDFVGRDGVVDMKELVSRLVTNINLPLMLDSTEYQKMESGLKQAGGKCILNSTNYEDGKERFFKVLDLAKNYGAAIVIGTIDEEGMARTADKKLQIAKRAFKDITDYGIPANEIFYDPLALPISTGIEEDRNNAKETIDSIKLIKKSLPNVHIILGISNVSFGLSSSARIVLNSIFLNEAISAGLDSAIVSPSKILPLSKINQKERTICLDLIYDKRRKEDNICVYDPLTELTTAFQNIDPKITSSINNDLEKLIVEERLKKHIIDGEKTNLYKTLDEALVKYNPLSIINNYLLDGMKVVGDLFGSGQMQLPFVLQSAETMKYAVSYLEPLMDKSETEKNAKGRFIIATVKGDVHDIGKNLVDIILTNNGYEVINLGIKQEVNLIIEAQMKYKADCIAMSGLLVKSTAFMKDNLQALNDANISIPVILGGAALTPKFVDTDCAKVYKGKVIYGKDAFTDLKFMDAYMQAKNSNNWDDKIGFKDSTPKGIKIGEYKQKQKNKEPDKSKPITNMIHANNKQDVNYTTRSVSPEEPVEPPFIGTNILQSTDIDLLEIIKYLDKNALYAGQWQMKRLKSQSKEDYKSFITKNAEPILEKWINKIIDEKLVEPKAVYGYFPCGRIGNNLRIYTSDKTDQIGCFQFPRQKSGKRYCISDFYNDIQNKSNTPIDNIAMQAVTMGESASIYAQTLFRNNSYSEYLYFHGLTVQLAEALAEYTHKIIRKECGFEAQEPTMIKGLLEQRYRGCRYSFGYPACPNVEDSRKQLEWLEANRIGITMDESEQLHPEQSTTAIITFHNDAKYFGC